MSPVQTTGCATAAPSLALIKYWGKASSEENLPATGSLAVTLGGLETKTRVFIAPQDTVVLDGVLQSSTRFQTFFDSARKALGVDHHYGVVSTNSFPTAAGLASSSSGFAALAGALSALYGNVLNPSQLSTLARVGSGSATRAVYGGFTLFPAGAHEATPLEGPQFWPQFRTLIATVHEGPKAQSSRKAMELSRTSSPYYSSWVQTSPQLLQNAVDALKERNWMVLGPLIQQSYLRMFSTMFTSWPPVIYWKPDSLALILLCQQLREEGVEVWETMDAGPQVKLFCMAKDAQKIQTRIQDSLPQIKLLLAPPGEGLKTWTEEKEESQLWTLG